MNEINNIEQIEASPLENKQLEQMNELSDINKTIEELINNEIMELTTGQITLKPKEKTIKKKYHLLQYNLNINEFIYIGKFTTFTEITKYLEKQDIHINLKTLIKNNLFKIELII